ncbi:hypothetical protein QJS83_14380 [Bdellovibrio sp. 22V]|uniref:hypothetical protein n=1 Tax=Bdellovibrio TaxID=958 RepID=UPI002542A7C6|nr:hypothetical protein [Bdellovibrio sp. 22V]WII71652.1 hypothetical protein QJS83_14380 [Bdellovibrio sp. 22V]
MRTFLAFFLGTFLSLTSDVYAKDASPPLAPTSPLQISVNNETLKEESNQYYYINFGSVRVHWSRYENVILRNTGAYPVEIRGVFITGSAFYAWSNCPRWLQPRETCATRVEFRPWYDGHFAGRLRFAFSYDNIYVDLYGWGVRW